MSVAYGSIQSTPEPAVFTLGIIRDPVIQYRQPQGKVQNRLPYYRSSSRFSSGNYTDIARAVLDDYDRASQASSQLDLSLYTAGIQINNDYVELLTLGARQIFGALDITTSDTADPNDVMVFMKNMGGAGSDAT